MLGLTRFDLDKAPKIQTCSFNCTYFFSLYIIQLEVMSNITLEMLTSLCKRRGFIYQGSEIYGGLAGTWDYGPLGIALKRNITNLWWKTFVEDQDNVYGLDTAILMSPRVWEASGHVATFNDPVIEDVVSKKQYRLDHLLDETGLNT